MPHNQYLLLPFEALVELLIETTREFFRAYERNDEVEDLANLKRQVELLHTALVLKRAERKPDPPAYNP